VSAARSLSAWRLVGLVMMDVETKDGCTFPDLVLCCVYSVKRCQNWNLERKSLDPNVQWPSAYGIGVNFAIEEKAPVIFLPLRPEA
jgi:hypothetical protein